MRLDIVFISIIVMFNKCIESRQRLHTTSFIVRNCIEIILCVLHVMRRQSEVTSETSCAEIKTGYSSIIIFSEFGRGVPTVFVTAMTSSLFEPE